MYVYIDLIIEFFKSYWTQNTSAVSLVRRPIGDMTKVRREILSDQKIRKHWKIIVCMHPLLWKWPSLPA